MPIINRPYQDALYHALNIYRDTMRPFIIDCLKNSSANSMGAITQSLWEGAVGDFDKTMEKNGNNIEAAIDIGMFAAIIDRNWDDAFVTEFNGRQITVIAHLNAISEMRNSVAHPSNCDTDQRHSHDVLARIANILRDIGRNEEAAAVDRIQNGLSCVPDCPGTTPSDPPAEPSPTIAEQVTQQLTPIIREQATLAKESTAHVLQELRALSARINDAVDNPRTTEKPPRSGMPPVPRVPRSPVERATPASIADLWVGVVRDLNNVKGNKYDLAALLRDCRPIDVWHQSDPEKLILPFRHQYNLERIQEELADPSVQETIEMAIAKHFNRELEFEPILAGQA